MKCAVKLLVFLLLLPGMSGLFPVAYADDEVSTVLQTEVSSAEEELIVPESAPETDVDEGTTEALASSDSGQFGQNLTWSFDAQTGVLTISGNGSMAGSWGYNGQPWNAYLTEIEKVVIQNGVTDIGAYAFAGCSSLASVSIPESVVSIGGYAFYNCGVLEEVDLPEGIQVIESAVFYNCKYLTEIKIPEGVTQIKGYAFFGCNWLSAVSIPETVTAIGTSAFSNCPRLAAITLPESLTSLGGGVFSGCTKLSTVTIPAGVTRLGGHSFYGCSGLLAVNLPENLSYIGINEFYDCTALTSITMPETLNRIDYCAFVGCIDLTEIYFTGDMPDIEASAFEGVRATAVYPAGNSTYNDETKGDYGGTLSWVPDSYGTLPVPAAPTKVVNVISGVHVYWTRTDGISNYGLWRSETGKNGGYQLIATTTSTHYIDTTAISGVSYHYKLTCYNMEHKLHSDKSDGVGITFVSTPDLTQRVNRAAGIGLSWDKISGATGYAVYRKLYSGSDPWVRVATISGGETTSWNDTSVKNNNGQIYRYTVRTLAGTNRNILSGCHGVGRTMVRLTTRNITKAQAVGRNSILCSWATTKLADGYEIRLMTNGQIYETFTIGNYKTGTKTLNYLRSGLEYKIQVRSYKRVSGVGTFYSAWSPAWFVTLG